MVFFQRIRTVSTSSASCTSHDSSCHMRESCCGLHPLPPFFISCHPSPLYQTLEKLVHRIISTPTLRRSATLGPAFAISGSSFPTQKPAFGLVPSPANLINLVALPSLDTDSFLYSVAAVCSDGWACRKHLCFSPETCIPQRRPSLLKGYPRPHSHWLLLRLNAPCGAVLPKITAPHGFLRPCSLWSGPCRTVSCTHQPPRGGGRAALLG